MEENSRTRNFKVLREEFEDSRIQKFDFEFWDLRIWKLKVSRTQQFEVSLTTGNTRFRDSKSEKFEDWKFQGLNSSRFRWTYSKRYNVTIIKDNKR